MARFGSAPRKLVSGLVEENYGQRKINISPVSVSTGALGAAIFAVRAKNGSDSQQEAT